MFELRNISSESCTISSHLQLGLCLTVYVSEELFLLHQSFVQGLHEYAAEEIWAKSVVWQAKMVQRSFASVMFI